MLEFDVVIGLEVHVHLATQSKLFCACPNNFGDEPNTNVCEVCAGMPGVLPVVNGKAIEYACRMAMAVNATINKASQFARKNYFYPDMPKNYQISQFSAPLCEHGFVDIALENGSTKRIGVTRIHLEDDAGKNIHSASSHESFVDLNRSGAPLIEIVSEPDLSSAAEAVIYLKTLHGFVTSLGVGTGNMEEGAFRCDANISLKPKGSATLGTRTELKNLNSFKFVQKAIEYEIERQRDILEDGGTIRQETRLYDSAKNITLPMRSKEDAQDYRYFPDPDLLPLTITESELAEWAATQKELPAARLARFEKAYNLPAQDAAYLTADIALANFFEAACKAPQAAQTSQVSQSTGLDPRKIANLIQGPLMREMNTRNLEPAALGDATLTPLPAAIAELAQIIDQGLISAKIGADIMPDLFGNGIMPEALVKEKGLMQVSDAGAIEAAARAVVEANPKETADYKAGKTKLISFFMGQVMRQMQGKANPTVVTEALEKILGE